MKHLYELIKNHESWLTSRALYYAKEHNYVKYTSTLIEATRKAVEGLSQAIYRAVSISEQVHELGPDDDYTVDPTASFGILEAKKHRERGVTLDMFLGRLKYYRQSFTDLIHQAGFAREYDDHCQLFVNRVFDRIEIGFCLEWTGNVRSKLIKDLQDCNRNITNEKNKYLTVFESLPNPVILLNSDNQIVVMNHAASGLLLGSCAPGAYYYSEKQKEDRLPWLHEELISFTACDNSTLSYEFERELKNKNGTGYFEVKFTKMLDVSGKFSGTVVILNDISNRKKMEDKLRKAEAKFRTLVEQIPAVTYIEALDNARTKKYVSPQIEQLLGFSPAEIIADPRLWFRQMQPEDHQRLLDIYQGKTSDIPVRSEYCMLSCNGRKVWVRDEATILSDETGQPYMIQGVLLDITERKQFENEIARLDRLNLIGEMAAGIGHEIRNPMTTVRGFLQWLSNKKECAKYKEYYDLMIDELNRANSIISEYLSLAKNRTINLKEQNLNAILETMFPLIQADAMVSDKYVVLDLAGIPDLLLDEKEIRQLILNLIRNGLEAMPAGGAITIRTYQEGNKAILSIQDEGPGINPDVIEKLGTPFFSTKEQGAGLGLAVCYSIATRHEAAIDVKTGPNGTTFFVQFKTSR